MYLETSQMMFTDFSILPKVVKHQALGWLSSSGG